MESVLPTLINSSTETSTSELRRSKARHVLLSRVTDRSTKPAVRWSRSVSEVHIANYRNECRKVGAPSLFQRHNVMSSGLCKKEEGGVQPESLTMAYSYFAASGDGKRKAVLVNGKKKPHGDMGFGLHREMSLTEVHQIMKGEDNGNEKGDVEVLPKISLNIHRSTPAGSPPEVKLLLKRLPPTELQVRNLQTPYSQTPPRAYGELQKRRESSSVGIASERSKLNALPASGARCLQRLEREKMTSQERARLWIQRSPLGPESAPDEDLEEESMQHLKQIAPLAPLHSADHQHDHRPPTVIDIAKPIELRHKPTSKSAGAGKKKGKENDEKAKGKKVRFGENSWQEHELSNDYLYYQ